MTNPVFPTLSTGSDSSKHSVTQEDVSIRTELEGGYVSSRPRHTRQPRRTFTVGYTEIGDADRYLLNTFYDQMKGGSVIFEWTDPETKMFDPDGLTYQVRFKGPLKWNYKGIGLARLWTVEFEVEQV